MKVTRTINATYRAIQDRAMVTMNSGRRLNEIDKRYYDKMVQISGPSVHKPNKVLKSLIKAYKHQKQKLIELEELNAPFREPYPLVSDAKALLKGVINVFKKG